MKRIDELTGLRCLAVGMVVLGHSTEFLPDWGSFFLFPFHLFGQGDLGVQIFFVLSGFLITKLLCGEFEQTGKLDFWAFYRRRLLQISPAFYVYLAGMGVFAYTGMVHIAWQQFLLSGLYIWNYAHLLGLESSYLAHPDGVWYLGHTWSLALEEQFYWAWPALLWSLLRRGKTWWLSVIILIVPVIRIFSYFATPGERPQLEMMFHTGIDSILVGCFVALNHDALRAKLNRVLTSGAAYSLLVCLVFLVLPNLLMTLGGYWNATFGRTIDAGLIGTLFLCVLEQPSHWFSKLLRRRSLVFVGTISYSLYLWQQFFNNPDSPAFMGFPLNIVESVLAATLSYRFIERPFLRLKGKTQGVSHRSPETRESGTGLDDRESIGRQSAGTVRSR